MSIMRTPSAAPTLAAPSVEWTDRRGRMLLRRTKDRRKLTDSVRMCATSIESGCCFGCVLLSLAAVTPFALAQIFPTGPVYRAPPVRKDAHTHTYSGQREEEHVSQRLQ
jgi:hypothetical protein